MKIFLGFCFLLFYATASACSGYTKPFCVTHAQRPNDLVVKGTITASGTQSIQLEVLEVLYGIETRSVITIWDGKDFDCNGKISMKVALLGPVGDTLVAILPMITTTVNIWDIPGDYGMPYWLYYIPILKMKNDSIRGFINGSYGYQPGTYWAVSKMKYNEFKAYWIEHQGDCTALVGLAENSNAEDLQVSWDGNDIELRLPDGAVHEIRVLSMQGKILLEAESSSQLIISLENYASGMYLICVSGRDGKSYRQKIIR